MKVKINLCREAIFTVSVGKPTDLQCRLSVYLQNRLVLYNFLIYKNNQQELLCSNLTLFCVCVGPPPRRPTKSPPPVPKLYIYTALDAYTVVQANQICKE
jgi:hypothetical protein